MEIGRLRSIYEPSTRFTSIILKKEGEVMEGDTGARPFKDARRSTAKQSSAANSREQGLLQGLHTRADISYIFYMSATK